MREVARSEGGGKQASPETSDGNKAGVEALRRWMAKTRMSCGELAAALGVRWRSVRDWIGEIHAVPCNKFFAIERATDGAVPVGIWGVSPISTGRPKRRLPLAARMVIGHGPRHACLLEPECIGEIVRATMHGAEWIEAVHCPDECAAMVPIGRGSALDEMAMRNVGATVWPNTAGL
jgi:hypothetical protein